MGVVLGGIGLILVLIIATYYLTAARLKGSGMGESAIAERIAPVGRVEVAGGMQDATPTADSTADAPAAAAGSSGEDVYNRTCVACHASGAAGAPKLGDKAAWEPRTAQGMDALMNSVLNGKNAMPPRGTCASCSDDELRATVEFMISKAQ
jgi:cytochrome c5